MTTPLADLVNTLILCLVSALAMCTTNCSHFLDCESRHGLYHCNCQAGFTGPHCDINVDECSSSPCVHGKCEDGVNRYDCAVKGTGEPTAKKRSTMKEVTMFLRPMLHWIIFRATSSTLVSEFEF